MPIYTDLHIHTAFSDGSMTPYEIIEYAHKKGISALSITDHDTTFGINDALKRGKEMGIYVVPGIELSTNESVEFHILGYFIDIKSIRLQEYLKLMKENEVYWVIKTIKKLRKLNINLNIKDIMNENGKVDDGSIAIEMVKKQYANSYSEVQSKFLDKGMPAYVEIFKYSPEQCIQLIEQANGVSVLAHPMRISKNIYEIFDIIKKLMKFGLKGVECFHPDNSHEFTHELLIFAKENNLLVTGGSDFHRLNKSADLGELKISIEIFNEILIEYNKLNRYKIK